jgi:small subunit ribosomal protein S17
MADDNETPEENEDVAEDAGQAAGALAEEPVAETAAEADAPAETDAETEAPAEVEPELEVAAEAEPEPAAETEPQEPPAEEAPAVEAAAEAPAEAAAPAPQSGPKPKRKRVPRAERPQRSKKTPAKPATRKPIVRLEKPEHERGRRQERQGTVVSSAMDKTIVVKVDTLKAHPRYKKVVRRSTTFHAHDESNQANVGDVVRIVETRPVSKTKRWRLAEIVEAAR